MNRQPEEKITALYERLSIEDARDTESNSIKNQKAMLTEFAEKNGFTNIRHFAEACDIIEPNPGSLATSGFRAIWSKFYYALGLVPRPLISRT